MKVNDLTNKKFGKLTVIKRSGDHIQPNGKKVTMWECKCECEKTKDVMAQNLVNGSNLSCGCYSKSINRELLRKRRIKHGE